MAQPKTTHATKFSPQLVTQFKIVHATGFNGTKGRETRDGKNWESEAPAEPKRQRAANGE
jgi:hypothetical protein